MNDVLVDEFSIDVPTVDAVLGPTIQEEILVALRDENRFRKVKFNTIALVFGKSKIEKAWKYEDPEEMGAFMRRIAEETGGHSVVIAKPFFNLKD